MPRTDEQIQWDREQQKDDRDGSDELRDWKDDPSLLTEEYDIADYWDSLDTDIRDYFQYNKEEEDDGEY